MSRTKVWILWVAVFLSFLLFIATAQASVKDDALKVLEKHGLALGMKQPTGCGIVEIGQPTRITKVFCTGPNIDDYTRRAWDVLEAAGFVVDELGMGLKIEVRN